MCCTDIALILENFNSLCCAAASVEKVVNCPYTHGQMHQFPSVACVLGCSKQVLQFMPDNGEYEYFLYYSAPGKDNYYKQNQMKI